MRQGRLLVVECTGVRAIYVAFAAPPSIIVPRSFARLIPAMGILPEEEGKDWVEHMVRSHDEGTFFASGAFYTYHAAKC